MNIQWYPGHMTKSMRLIEQNLSLVDAVLYVLDARAVNSCFNPSFDKVITNKKILYIINKIDLADEKVNKLWEEYFKQNNLSYAFINGTQKKYSNIVIGKIKGLLAEKIERYSKKNIILPLRCMVIGIPNSGKSTIINTLSGGKRAQTGNRPGVTKGKQWIKTEGGIEILDTPGTLWNAFADRTQAMHLAYIGSISDNVVDIEELCVNLLQEVKGLYPNTLNQKYGIDLEADGREILLAISNKKGCLTKNGVDTLRGANAVIDDFRKGKIARISLERP